MADFYAPQFQNPDFLKSYVQGAMAPSDIAVNNMRPAMAQQQLAQGNMALQTGQLNLDQLRQVMQMKQQAMADYQRTLGTMGGGPAPTGAPPNSAAVSGAQAGGSGVSGGIQNGPQGAVGAASNDPLAPLLDQRRVAANAAYGSFNAMLSGGDPNKPIADAQALNEAARVDAQKRAQQQVESSVIPITSAVMNAKDADIMVNKNPALRQEFAKWCMTHGLNPDDPKNLTTANAQQAAWEAENSARGQAGMPMLPPLERYSNAPGGIQIQSTTGKANAIPGAITPDAAAHLSIEQQRLDMAKKVSEGFAGDKGDLLAALTLQGVSLPAGMRSKEQQIATLQGLLDRNPGMSPDEIASQVKSGKIDLAGQMKEQTTAGGISGKVKYAENELSQSIPLALEASKAVDRGSFVPLNKLMQMANTSISDPDLLNLKIKTQSVLNAYDMLAARGGTDVGKRDAQHALLSSAQSPEAFATALKAFEQEAQVAKSAAAASMGRKPEPVVGAHPPAVQSLLDKYK